MKKDRLGINPASKPSANGYVHARRRKPLRLRKCVPHSRKGEGLHLPPVSEALNRA